MLLIVLGVLVILGGVFLMGAWSMFGTKITAAKSVKKLEDNLYSMEFIGDYGFDAYLAQGGAASEAKMAEYITSFLSNGFVKAKSEEVPKDFGCSTLVVKGSDGGYCMGRNYDWQGDKSNTMIIHTKPENGYESYSTCWLDFLGFGKDWKSEGMQNQYMALAAIYVPMDGMNEKGLCVADLICGDVMVETHQTAKEADLTTTSAIRLLLDKAADVDEAIALLEQYNMHSSVGMAHHFAIADANGKSVVVEYVNNEMIVTETSVVTNHYLSEGEMFGMGNAESHNRYEKLMQMYENAENGMTAEEMKNAMKAVSYENITQWSIVYNIEECALDFYWQRGFDAAYHFEMHK